MNLDNHKNVLKQIDPYTADLVRCNMDILDRIHYLIDKHFGGSQVELAKKLNISEARVSKMVNGLQNFKLKTLKKLEQAFGEKIIVVPYVDEHGHLQIGHH